MNQLFLGTFVHCQDRQHLEYLHNAAVCVDGDGKIKLVVKGKDDVAGAKKEALREIGWKEEDITVQTCKPGQFFFPGFVGETFPRNRATNNEIS